MRNVLSLVNCTKLEQSLSWKESCFDSLFLQGFWKKLVFLLDSHSSMELCLATNDLASFKIIYLVHKLGLSDPVIMKEALDSNESFWHLLKDDKGTSDVRGYAEELLTFTEISQ